MAQITNDKAMRSARSKFHRWKRYGIFLLPLCLMVYRYRQFSVIKRKEIKLSTPETKLVKIKKRPIIYTYIDRSLPGFDDALLNLWIDSWEEAGWRTKILNPHASRYHRDYKKYSKRLDEAGILHTPRITYTRIMAMAIVKEGGFYSEYYVFPLSKAYNSLSMANGGNFTSYDGVFGSFLSGTNKEWNRFLRQLMENIDKNAFLSFRKLLDLDPHSFHSEELLATSASLVCSKKFESDTCIDDTNKVAIRVHSSEIRIQGYNVFDRPALVESWFKIYWSRCVRKQPIIFTFYENINYLDKMEDFSSLLKVWKEVWSEAGWHPIVLSLADSRRHPEYHKFNTMLNNDDQFTHGRSRYDYYCFMRWLAMAASGGGWMVDIDVFPLSMKPTLTLPNQGTFTGHNFGKEPSLVSGNRLEWERMTNLIFDSYNGKKIPLIIFPIS